MGQDLKTIYIQGRNQLLEIATKKIKNTDKKKIANLRAAHMIFWDGSLAALNNEFCAEYFGGLLANSMSEDGQDDSVMPYIDTVKSMSSNQLKLHYCIYDAFQTIFNKSSEDINLQLDPTSKKYYIGIPTLQLNDKLSSIVKDLTILQKIDLIDEFSSVTSKEIIVITPTSFGIQLFAAAHNNLENWADFGRQKYEPVHDIQSLQNVIDWTHEILTNKRPIFLTKTKFG